MVKISDLKKDLEENHLKNIHFSNESKNKVLFRVRNSNQFQSKKVKKKHIFNEILVGAFCLSIFTGLGFLVIGKENNNQNAEIQPRETQTVEENKDIQKDETKNMETHIPKLNLGFEYSHGYDFVLKGTSPNWQSMLTFYGRKFNQFYIVHKTTELIEFNIKVTDTESEEVIYNDHHTTEAVGIAFIPLTNHSNITEESKLKVEIEWENQREEILISKGTQ